LGFTYEIKGMETQEGENWSEMLLRTVGQGDLWMSWWARTASRMNQTSMLNGHVDISPVLAIPPPSMAVDPDLSETFTTFFDPFSTNLWICLIAMIFLSGVTDWLLERASGGSFLGSIYEYFGGVLFGGFSDPYTRLSCVYQCIVAFIILIVVSAYTANLASAMTISRQPESSFGSIDEVIATKTAACVAGSYSGQDTIEILYPSLMYDKDTAGWFDSIDDGLLDGSCQCAVIPRIEYDTWLTEGPNCQQGIAGGSLFFASAGWVTNLNSTLCVQRSIEYAFHQLQGSGVLSDILSKWLPTAACGAPVKLAGDAERRRLRDGEPSAPERPAPSKRRQQRRRRLKGGGGNDAGVTSGGDDSGSEFTMHVTDFFGLFVLWCAATFLLLATQGGFLAWGLIKTRILASRGITAEGAGSQSGEMKDVDGDHFPDDLNGDNTNAMLRYLVTEITQLREAVNVIEATNAPGPAAHDTIDVVANLSRRGSKFVEIEGESISNGAERQIRI